MEKFIYVSGVFFLVSLALIAIWLIISTISTYYENKKERKWFKTHESIGNRLIAGNYWLTGQERKPFRVLVNYIGEQLRDNNTLDHELLRQKVDWIIKEYNVQSAQNLHNPPSKTNEVA